MNPDDEYFDFTGKVLKAEYGAKFNWENVSMYVTQSTPAPVEVPVGFKRHDKIMIRSKRESDARWEVWTFLGYVDDGLAAHVESNGARVIKSAKHNDFEFI